MRITGRRPKRSDHAPRYRRKNELHGGPGKSEKTGDAGGARDVSVFELNDQVGQHRSDDAEGQKIQQDGYENESEGGLAEARRREEGRIAKAPCEGRTMAARSTHFLLWWGPDPFMNVR